MSKNITKTPEERLKIYEFILEFIEHQEYPKGLCSAIFEYEYRNRTAITSPTDEPDGILQLFPEIWEQKPEHTFSRIHWFSRNGGGQERRMEIVEKAIEKVKTLINEPNTTEAIQS